MRTLRTTGLLATFVGIVGISLLTGCVAVGDYGGDGDRGHFYPDGGSAKDVEGIVERVDPANRRIVVAEVAETAETAEIAEGDGPADDRGPADARDEPRNGGREIALYYDDGTVVEHEGQSYRPQALEPGDHIRAEVTTLSWGLMTRRIEVLADVNAGPLPEPAPAAPDVPAAPGAPVVPAAPDDRRDDGSLRGTVRYVDTRAHLLEIETPGENGRPGLLQVLYDGETDLEVEGRRYSPESLEPGDQVEIDVRDHHGRPLAKRIVVVGEG